MVLLFSKAPSSDGATPSTQEPLPPSVSQVPGALLRGFPGWFVTRTYHLYQLPLLTRKLRVVADWTTALFFRRDIAELGMIGHPERLDT